MVNNELNVSEVRTLFHLFNCTYDILTQKHKTVPSECGSHSENLRVISKCVVLRNTYELAITWLSIFSKDKPVAKSKIR